MSARAAAVATCRGEDVVFPHANVPNFLVSPAGCSPGVAHTKRRLILLLEIVAYIMVEALVTAAHVPPLTFAQVGSPFLPIYNKFTIRLHTRELVLIFAFDRLTSHHTVSLFCSRKVSLQRVSKVGEEVGFWALFQTLILSGPIRCTM